MSVIVSLCLRLHCFSSSVCFWFCANAALLRLGVCGLSKATVQHNPKMPKNLTKGEVDIDKKD